MLKLLLDEHITPDVADGLRRRDSTLIVHYMSAWERGNYLGKEDSILMREAAKQDLTLVTYDRRTIPPLLKLWADEERSHGGVIFIDEKTLQPNDVGGIVLALFQLYQETGDWNWTNRIHFLRR